MNEKKPYSSISLAKCIEQEFEKYNCFRIQQLYSVKNYYWLIFLHKTFLHRQAFRENHIYFVMCLFTPIYGYHSLLASRDVRLHLGLTAFFCLLFFLSIVVFVMKRHETNEKPRAQERALAAYSIKLSKNHKCIVRVLARYRQFLNNDVLRYKQDPFEGEQRELTIPKLNAQQLVWFMLKECFHRKDPPYKYLSIHQLFVPRAELGSEQSVDPKAAHTLELVQSISKLEEGRGVLSQLSDQLCKSRYGVGLQMVDSILKQSKGLKQVEKNEVMSFFAVYNLLADMHGKKPVDIDDGPKDMFVAVGDYRSLNDIVRSQFKALHLEGYAPNFPAFGQQAMKNRRTGKHEVYRGVLLKVLVHSQKHIGT